MRIEDEELVGSERLEHPVVLSTFAPKGSVATHIAFCFG